MSWLSGPVPHADETHSHVRFAIDLNQFHPLSAEHWAWIANHAHTANEWGTSTLERIVVRATIGTKVDAEFVRSVRMARAVQAHMTAEGKTPFRLGAYMLLRPPTLLASVRAQVSAFAKATLILGAERREFAAVDVEKIPVPGNPDRDMWDGLDVAGPTRKALEGVAGRLSTRPYLYTYSSFFKARGLAACMANADLWGAWGPPMVAGSRIGSWAAVDAKFTAFVEAWQFGGGPLGAVDGWPPISKTVLRS